MTEPAGIQLEFESFEKFTEKYQVGGKWALFSSKVGAEDIINSLTHIFGRFFIDKVKIAGDEYYVVNLSDE